LRKRKQAASQARVTLFVLFVALCEFQLPLQGSANGAAKRENSTCRNFPKKTLVKNFTMGQVVARLGLGGF
jgi:hypothetical protein